jgi:transcriptional regulator with XRE-family HTH domain
VTATATGSPLVRALGAALRKRRKALGLTLAGVAGASGVSLGYVSQVERGANSPSLETLGRLAAALGVRASVLVAEAEAGAWEW